MLYGLVERTWILLQISLFATLGLCFLVYKMGVIIQILPDSGKDMVYENH